MLERNKKRIYLCKRDVSRLDIDIYKEPIAYRVNVMAMSDELVLNTMGNTNSSYVRVKVPVVLSHKFSKGDKCYVYEPLPHPFDILCNDADYIVESIVKGHQYASIILKGLV